MGEALRTIFSILLIAVALLVGAASNSSATVSKASKALLLEGKAYYRVTRNVKNTHKGTLSAVFVRLDQRVSKGEVLGEYTLDEAERDRLQRRINFPAIRKIKMDIEEESVKIHSVEGQLEYTENMVMEGMISSVETEAIRSKLSIMKDRLAYLKEELDHLQRDRRREIDEVSSELGGVSLKSGVVPRVVKLVAPVDGYILWNRRVGAKLRKELRCFKVGKLEKLTIKAKVYVEDYPKLRRGMVAKVTSKEHPKKTFSARLTKLPLTPVDKKYAALSYYLVEFVLDNSDLLFREGNRLIVRVPAVKGKKQ